LPDRAALCQILRDGVTGFVSSSLDDLVAAVQKIPDISRRKCRDEFERRFTAEVMAANYERVYYQLAGIRRFSARKRLFF
jgi:glycosyltransferase involved in cell wall biosynthesis